MNDVIQNVPESGIREIEEVARVFRMSIGIQVLSARGTDVFDDVSRKFRVRIFLKYSQFETKMRLVTYQSEDVASDGNVGSMTNTALTGTIKSYNSPRHRATFEKLTG